MEQTYDGWMEQVDDKVWEIAGCSIWDLTDACLADWYEDDLTPCQAAKKAIRYANGGEE